MIQNMDRNTDTGITIRVPIPAQDPTLYGRGAVDDVLLFLTRHRFESFTVREIQDQLDASEGSIRRAIDVLEGNDLVVTEREGNRKPIQINRSRLSVPEDPFLQIPQPEFHEPVKTATEQLTETLEDVLGIVLYGSVARGEADRRSDIDLWAVVNGNRAPAQRAANDIERDLEDQRFDGQRYDFHIAVESIESVPAFTDDISEILQTGIPVYRTEEFDTLQKLLVHGDEDG